MHARIVEDIRDKNKYPNMPIQHHRNKVDHWIMENVDRARVSKEKLAWMELHQGAIADLACYLVEMRGTHTLSYLVHLFSFISFYSF